VGGALLLRKVMVTKFQLPDSFPYILEQEFNNDAALEYERYVALGQERNNVQIDNLDKYQNFQVGVDHMNQIVSFDRVVYYGYIQEKSKDPKLVNHPDMQGPRRKIPLAFGTRVGDQKAAEELHLPPIESKTPVPQSKASPSFKKRIPSYKQAYSHQKALNN